MWQVKMYAKRLSRDKRTQMGTIIKVYSCQVCTPNIYKRINGHKKDLKGVNVSRTG